MIGIDVKNIRFRQEEKDGFIQIFLEECYADLCDCDIDAKDDCEDCNCGLAWVVEKSTLIFGTSSENRVIMIEDKYLNG